MKMKLFKSILILFFTISIINNIKAQPIDFEVIGYTNSGCDSEDIEIISNDKDFSRRWKREIFTDRPISIVNFDKELVIAISRGQCGSGGYSVYVDSIYLDDQNLIFDIIYSNPSDNCRRTWGVTRPTILIRIKNKGYPHFFSKSTIIKFCD